MTSWQRLVQIPGLGIPTASCLLAALWPDSHAIMDVLDRRAVIGVQVGRRSHIDRRLDAARVPSHEWWFYDWFRQTVTLTAQAADCEPVSGESALYILGARTARELGNDWTQHGTWSEFYHAAPRPSRSLAAAAAHSARKLISSDLTGSGCPIPAAVQSRRGRSTCS
jgi:hypothetical protein